MIRKSNTFASKNFGTPVDTTLWQVSEYDALDRVTKSTAFDGTVSTQSYDGRTHTLIDDAGPEGLAVIETRVSDARGNVVQVEDDAGGMLTFSYDAGGRLTQSTAAGSGKSVVTRMEYDVAGNRTALNDPNLGQRRYEYDIFQRMTLQVNGVNQTTTMKYDTLGRMTERQSPEGLEEWVFDRVEGMTAIGKLMEEKGTIIVSHGSRPTKSYRYDTIGRLTSVDSVVKDTKASVHHGYNATGQISRRAYKTESETLYHVDYTYDARGFLVTATGSDGKDWFSNAKYTANGDVRSFIDGAGALTVKDHDPATGHLNAIDVTNQDKRVVKLGFEFDSTGNMTKRTTSMLDRTKPATQKDPIQPEIARVEDFKYDRLNRLTSYPTGVVRYDALGNLTSRTDLPSGATTDLVYGASQPNAVSQAGSLSYEYDASGNMTKRGSTSVTWSSFDKPSLMMFGGNDYTAFEYDAGRNRVHQFSREAAKGGQTLYEDAEDGSIASWGCDRMQVVKDNGGLAFYDPSNNAESCKLRTDEHTLWDGKQPALSWMYKDPTPPDDPLDKPPRFLVSVETTKGNRTLEYGSDLLPGQFDVPLEPAEPSALGFFTVVRDVEADLKRFEPEAELIKIVSFQARGAVIMDNIGSPHPESQWTRRIKEKYYWFQDFEKTDVYGERCITIATGQTNCSGESKQGAYVVRIAGPEATTLGSIALTEPHKGKRSYYYTDHLGSVVARGDDTGTIEERFHYDPWGRPLEGAWSQTTAGPVKRWPDYGFNDRGFSGHEMLGVSQLVHMNGRIYDPAIGRFLSPDPLVKGGFNLQSHNRYSYVLNNPLVHIDPSGHFFKKIGRFFKRAFKKVKRFFKKYGAFILSALAAVVTGGWALAIAPLSWGAVPTAVFVGAVSGFTSGFAGSLISGQGLSTALKAGLTGAAISGALAGVQASVLKYIYKRFTPADKMEVELFHVRHNGRQLRLRSVSPSEVSGQSADIFINGQSNNPFKAARLGFERVQKDEFYLIHNPEVTGFMDTVESMVGKLTGRTPVSEGTAKILANFDLTNSHIYAHSQGGIITRNALVLRHRLGQDLAGLRVTFDGAAVNWASTSALFKTMGVSLPYRAFTAHPWDMVPNLTGYNALFPLPNPYRLIGSVLNAPWVFKGGPGSPHTHLGGGEAVRWAPQLLFRP